MSQSSQHYRQTFGLPRLARSQSRKLLLLIAVTLTVILLSVRSASLVYADSSIACAATSETLGQGFNVAGLGFNVAGLGFNVAGLGFNVAGLGFNVAGLGIDPLQFAAEIRDNTITDQWLQDLLPYIKEGSGYNTVKTAVLVIDDRAHGAQVLAVFDALKNTPGFNLSNIKVEFVDITSDNSDTDGMGYSTDDIDEEIRETVGRLWGEGYRHFVLNMSFGLVPCEDPGPTLNGVQYPWNFFDALEAVEEANENGGQSPKQPVVPVLECVYFQGEGNLTARFTYNNPNAYPVTIPVGSNNNLSGQVKSGSLPTLFEPGTRQNVFEILFDIRFQPKKGPVVWTLDGNTVSASDASPLCTSTAPTNDKSITPILECVADNGNGTYTARFGYQSANPGSVYIQAGGGGALRNYFTPSPENRGQPTYFMPGLSKSVFEVVFDGISLTWTVKGPDKVTRTATATSAAQPCVTDTGYDFGDYANGVLGVPDELVDDFLVYILTNVNTSDTSLDPLRMLLREYINRSKSLTDDSYEPFLAFPVASAGNFRPWLGSQPLAPASWSEVISVGATVGNYGSLWDFSHDGNVLSPGVAFPYEANARLAGTSFAAPFTSMYLAQWGTYPHACTFPVVNGIARPPLAHPDTLGNQQTTSSDPSAYINAFTCVKPTFEPIVCYATDVVNYSPGKRKDGLPISDAPPNRYTDPNLALGMQQNDDTVNFVSLGFGGSLILGFDNPILNINGTAPDLRVWETSNGDHNRPWNAYPEKVKIYASAGGSSGPWVLIGETSGKDQAYDLAGLGQTAFIKLVDTSDKTKFGWDTDGFDVDAIESFACGEDLGGVEMVRKNGKGNNNKNGQNRKNAKNNREVVPVVPGLRGTDPLGLVPTMPTTPDGLIPLPAAPSN